MAFALDKNLVPFLFQAEDGRLYANVSGGNSVKLIITLDKGVTQEVGAVAQDVPAEARVNGTKLYFNQEGEVTGWDIPAQKVKPAATQGSLTMRQQG
jgi:hypothetical protein